MSLRAFWRLLDARTAAAAAPAIPVQFRLRPDSPAARSGGELDKLDRKGTQSKVEAATSGKKLAPAAQADVDRYNALLNQYLGARCHV